MPLFKRFFIIIIILFTFISLGLLLRNPLVDEQPVEPIPVAYWHYAPDIDDRNSDQKAIVSWALKTQAQVALINKKSFSKIRCYTSASKNKFYRNLIKGEIDWVSISEVSNIFNKTFGFQLEKSILTSNDLQHITELLIINPSLATISISAKYLTEVHKKKDFFDLNKYCVTENIRLPFLYNEKGFAILDEMLLVSKVDVLWPIIQASFIARTQKYQEILSETFFDQAREKDIAFKIRDWAKKNPMALFYLPSIKAYCFGKDFWTDLFWEKKSHYLAINAKELDDKFFKPTIGSPTFFELQKIFENEVDDVAVWLALLGYLQCCETPSQPLITELRYRLYNLSQQAQKRLRTHYSSIYEHYLAIAT